MAKVNPFRFSTKYQDDESDLLYYGYRFYNASTGGWLNRDPIDESGGADLYAFIYNNPVNDTDYMGELLYMDVNGSGSSEIPSQIWHDMLPYYYAGIAGSYDLGFHGGFAYIYGNDIDGNEDVFKHWYALGMFMWEAKATVCYDNPWDHHLAFHDWIYNQVTYEEDKNGNKIPIQTYAPEIPDGPTGKYFKANSPYQYAADAPRYMMLKNRGSTFHFNASWRIIAQDDENTWQAKFKVSFTYSDKTPAAGSGTFTVLEEPHELESK